MSLTGYPFYLWFLPLLVLYIFWRTGDWRYLVYTGVVATLVLAETLSLELITIYIGLAVLFCVLFELWWRLENPRLKIGLFLLLGLTASLFVYDWVHVSVPELMEQKIKAMARAVGKGDPDAMLEHVSEKFTVGYTNKERLRVLATEYIQSGQLEEVKVWDFVDAEVHEATASIRFKVKLKGSFGEPFYRCKADFCLESDGEWRLLSFTLFWPTGEEIKLRVF